MFLPSFTYIFTLLCIVKVSKQDNVQDNVKQEITEVILSMEARIMENIKDLLNAKIPDLLEENLSNAQFTINQLSNSLTDVENELANIKNKINITEQNIIKEINTIKGDKDCSNENSLTTSVEKIASTTEASDGLDWLSVGTDRFVRFEEKMNWDDAQELCRGLGLDLYQPRDILKLARYLDDNFRVGSSEMLYWLGARGNGTHLVYTNGEVLNRCQPWQGSDYDQVQTDSCVYMAFDYQWKKSKKTKILTAHRRTCTLVSNVSVLCG